MRSIFYVGWAFVAFGAVAGCGEILGIEPWEDGNPQVPAAGTNDTPGSSSGNGGSGGGSAATCANGVQDGTETGVDCGGDGCDACDSAFGCTKDSDCLSGYCPSSRGYCAMPDGRILCGVESEGGATCADCMQNGAESDVDCGGDCFPCRADKMCTYDAECWSGRCGTDLRCVAGAKGTHCFSNADCESGSCGTLGCTNGTCCQ